MQLCLGTVYAWSYFQNPVSETYGWSNTEVAWVFSISIFMLGLSASAGGALMSRYGPRKLATWGGLCYSAGYLVAALALKQHSLPLLYIGFGVVGGVGLGLAYVTPVTAVSKWFPDKQGLVTGMVVMGFGLGAVLMSKVLAPIFMRVADNDLSTVFLYTGITLMALTVFAASFLKMPPNVTPGYNAPPKQFSGMPVSRGKLFLSGDFVRLWIIFVCIVVAGMIFISFQSPLLQALLQSELPWGTNLRSVETQHYLATAGATLIAVSSMFNGVGRIVWGAVSDRVGRLQSFRLILAILFIMFALLLVVKQPFLFSFLVCIVLLCYGGGFGVLPSLVKEFFGAENMAAVYGTMLTAWGVGGIIGPQIVAFTKDYYPGKAAAYSFVVALVLISVGLMLTLTVKKKT